MENGETKRKGKQRRSWVQWSWGKGWVCKVVVVIYMYIRLHAVFFVSHKNVNKNSFSRFFFWLKENSWKRFFIFFSSFTLLILFPFSLTGAKSWFKLNSVSNSTSFPLVSPRSNHSTVTLRVSILIPETTAEWIRPSRKKAQNYVCFSSFSSQCVILKTKKLQKLKIPWSWYVNIFLKKKA